MQRLSLQHICFSLRWKIISRPLLWLLFIGSERQSDGINGKPRVNWFPWSCSDIFCIHNISSTKSISNQSLSITAICLVHATRWSGTLQELDQRIIVSSRKEPPHRGTKEALRDKTKSCCTGLTCQHNNTKSWYCYYCYSTRCKHHPRCGHYYTVLPIIPL